MKSTRTIQPVGKCLAGTVLMLLGAAFTATSALQAQSVSFTGVQTTILEQLRSPGGLAVNEAGDVFIAERAAGHVIKVTAAGIPTTMVVSGVKSPEGLALDAGSV